MVVVVVGAIVGGAVVGGAVVVTAVVEVGGVVELVVEDVLEDDGVLEDAGAVLEDVVVVSGSEALMVLLVGAKVEEDPELSEASLQLAAIKLRASRPPKMITDRDCALMEKYFNLA